MFKKSDQPCRKLSKNFNKPKTASKYLVPKMNKQFIKIHLDEINSPQTFIITGFYDKMPQGKSASKQ